MSALITSINVDQAGGVTATLVAAKAGYKVQVVSFMLHSNGAAPTVKSTLQDETANTVRATFSGHATIPVVHTWVGGLHNPAFETALGEGLELVTGTAALIMGVLTYRYVY